MEITDKARALYPSDEAWRSYWAKLVNGLWVSEPKFELNELAAITAPTLILHGENEQFFDREISEGLVETLPNATMKIVPGGTHTSAQEKPDFVNAAIVEFVSSLHAA